MSDVSFKGGFGKLGAVCFNFDEGECAREFLEERGEGYLLKEGFSAGDDKAVGGKVL